MLRLPRVAAVAVLAGAGCAAITPAFRNAASDSCWTPVHRASLAQPDVASPAMASHSVAADWPLVAALGGRFGYLALGPTEGPQYENSLFLGLWLDLARGPDARCVWRIGFDTASLGERAGVGYESRILLERLDVRFPFMPGRNCTPYVTCGVGAMQELLIDDSGNVKGDNYAWPVDFGAGLTLWNGRLDVGVAYSILLDSEYVESITIVSVGMRF